MARKKQDEAPKAVAAKEVPKAAKKRKPAPDQSEDTLKVEVARIADLTPHPKNYKVRPEDQLLHIGASLKQFGYYKNVVVGRGGVILAGHGVVEAATKIGWSTVPIHRVDVDPMSPEALKILALDNELPKFAETDDRALSEILRVIREQSPTSLLGTGYEDQTVAALVMVTRPSSEIGSLNEAGEWLGMPEYDVGDDRIRMIVLFETDEARQKFSDDLKMNCRKSARVWSVRWPIVEDADTSSIRFETEGAVT